MCAIYFFSSQLEETIIKKLLACVDVSKILDKARVPAKLVKLMKV